MLPVRSPGPSRGSAAGAPLQQGIQPVTWATLPRAAQVLGLLALVHLLAVLITSLHSHSHGGGVVLFPLASLIRGSGDSKNLGRWQAPGTVPETVLEATEEVRIAKSDAEASTVRRQDEQAGRQLPDPATNTTRSQSSTDAGGEAGAAAALQRQKDDLSVEKQTANAGGKQRRAELDRIISERRQRLGTNAQQVNHKALAEQVEKEREKQARDKAEAEKQAKQAQPRVPGSTGSKVPRRKKRPTKKEQAEAVTSSLPAIKTGSCEEELPIPKVAMMFLTRGHLYHEELWAAWFKVASELLPHALVHAKGCTEEALQRIATACPVPRGNSTALQQQRLFSVHIHVGQDNAEFDGFPQGSLWHGRSLPERVKVEWGQHSMVDATRALLRNALKDPLNQKFILLSEAGIPLYPPDVLYHQLITEDKSRLHACVTPTWERHVHRWIDRMANEHLSKDHWRKSSQWFALTRAHAQLVVDDTIIDGIFRKDCYPTREDGWWRDCFGDEHYMATLMAALGREDETDCTGYLTNVDWSRGGGHPRSYMEREVSAARVRLLRLPAKECGYPAAIRTAREHFLNISSLTVDACSTLPVQYAPLGPQCPLLARKFPVETAQAVLRLLSDCKNRLKVLFLEDCRKHHRRRLLDDSPGSSAVLPSGDEAMLFSDGVGDAGGLYNISVWDALDQVLNMQDGLEHARVEVVELLQNLQGDNTGLSGAWQAHDAPQSPESNSAAQIESAISDSRLFVAMPSETGMTL